MLHRRQALLGGSADAQGPQEAVRGVLLHPQQQRLRTAGLRTSRGRLLARVLQAQLLPHTIQLHCGSGHYSSSWSAVN